jgi:hypothetical protein
MPKSASGNGNNLAGSVERLANFPATWRYTDAVLLLKKSIDSLCTIDILIYQHISGPGQGC